MNHSNVIFNFFKTKFMILITGATGHLGKATIDFLLKKGVSATNIVALVRDEAKAADLKALGVGLRKGDYNDAASLETAFQGIDKLLLVSSSDINDRTAQHLNAVNAAKKAGVKHIIYTSFQQKQGHFPKSSSPEWWARRSVAIPNRSANRRRR